MPEAGKKKCDCVIVINIENEKVKIHMIDIFPTLIILKPIHADHIKMF